MVTRFRVGTNCPTQCFNLHVSTISPIPKSYPIAFRDPNCYRAMLDEYTSLIKNNTWILVPWPPDANILHSMWLFWHKYNADGTLSRYKARLIANGSTQLAGIDVDETFSPVVKLATIRTVLSLAISRHWPVHQLDVKNAFLHGSLSETVYMHQPPGFRDPQHPDHVCLLQRSLYGLKQAPRAWFQRFAAYAARVGFHHSRCDSSLFIYRQGADTAYLLLYVDDIVLTASSSDLLQQIITSLHAEFSMTDLGSLNYFLGISVTRNASGMFLSQQKYATEVLDRAGMLNCKPCRTPVDTDSKLSADGAPISDSTLYRSLAGVLQYLTFTRPDISYVVQQIGYERGCPTTRRSTSDYCVFLGNNLLFWSSKRQFTLSRSSAEAEYRGVALRLLKLAGYSTGSRGAKLLVPNSKSGVMSAKWSLAPEFSGSGEQLGHIRVEVMYWIPSFDCVNMKCVDMALEYNDIDFLSRCQAGGFSSEFLQTEVERRHNQIGSADVVGRYAVDILPLRCVNPSRCHVDKLTNVERGSLNRMLSLITGMKRHNCSNIVEKADVNTNFDESIYTEEFLNNINMSCIPHHSLKTYNRPVSTARPLASKIAQSNSVIRPNHPRLDIGISIDFYRIHAVWILSDLEKMRVQLGFERTIFLLRCDNGTEFKNYVMNEFCAKKGIKREFSVARTLQQNGVAERKNRTLIEAARTMFIMKRIKGPHSEYYCFPPLQHKDKRFPAKDVVQDAQEQPSKNASPDKGIQVSEDVFDKEGQHQMPEDEQVWQDELEMMEINNWLEIHFLAERPYLYKAQSQTIMANSLLRAVIVAAVNSVGKHWNVKSVVTFEGRLSMDLRMDRSSPGKYNSSMVCKYALTHNPTIYDSLVKQFWQTATVRTLANGTQQLVASIDSTDLLLLRHLFRRKTSIGKMRTGKHNLFYAEIYAVLATQGRYLAPTLTKKLFANMKKGCAGDIVPLLPAMLVGAAVDQGEGSAQPAEPHHTPVDPISSTSQPPIPSPHQSSPHPLPLRHSPPHSPPQSLPHSSPPRSYEAPLPEGNTSGSAEASLQLKELMVLVPSLVSRVTGLETELKEIKQTLGNAVVKLVKKVKSLETALKRKSKKVLISESEGEESEDQGRKIQDIDDDPLVSLVRESMKEKSTDFVTPTKALGEAQEEEISPTILEAAKTLSKVASQGVSKEKSTDKGKRYRRRARSMAKKIDTGLDAEEEINTGREEINTGIEEKKY
ncbi:ribonuclease H-like domain-containing protein [Tanacetum coccineum]|uniref:Ribonuclease H-like domain-containing protein n=1 Tax=Tanacetum coccineum TaxID=301880 RepID=A0ABQ5DA33_9ASTR